MSELRGFGLPRLEPQPTAPATVASGSQSPGISAAAAVAERGSEPTAPTSFALSKLQIFAFGSVALSTQLLETPINVYLPPVYAKDMGLALGAIGMAVVITQTMNAVSQQLVGYLSDRTRGRFGARKPWIAGGATLAVIAAFFLLRPPPHVGILWFILWKILYDFGWAAKNVAHSAWGAELTQDYRERNLLMGTASFMSQAGYFLNETLPIVVFALGLVAASTYSMPVMGYYFILGAIAVPACSAFALAAVPKVATLRTARIDWRESMVALAGNKPFLRYIASFTLSSLAVGVVSITFIFYDGYLKVGNWFPWLMTTFSVASLISVPFWVWACNRIGKHRAYAIAISIGTTAPVAWLFMDPAHHSQIEVVRYAFGVVTVIGIGLGCNFIAWNSILADVADYCRWRTGKTRTGSYFAFYLLATKIAIAIGSGLAYMALGYFGYRSGKGIINTPSANLALLLIYALAPGALSVPAAILMWFFPITTRRQGIIQRRLNGRDRREAAALAAAQLLVTHPA